MGIQVSDLTRNKPCYKKEFIDFEFDGKHISEFGMVAVFDGGRHSFDASSDFEDEVSDIVGAPGQLYWGTKIKPLVKTFSLMTDGMTEQQVNAFKRHFRPGKYGKFIEDKLANRYGYCRIEKVVNFKVVPFQKKVSLMGYLVDINEYRGEAEISFVFDNPYLYSTINYIEENFNNLTEEDKIKAAKAVYNNGIPLSSSWKDVFFVNRHNSILGSAILGLMILGQDKEIRSRLCHLGQDKCLKFETTLKSVLVNDEGHVQINEKEPLIFYNPSNVQTPATIELNFAPLVQNVKNTFNKNLPMYFTNIADKYNNSIQYNTIELSDQLVSSIVDDHREIILPLKNEYPHKFYYTSPNVIAQIHEVITIANNFKKQGQTIALDLENRIQENITHDKVRMWAVSALAIIRANSKFCDENDCLLNSTIQLSLPFISSTALTVNWAQYFNIFMLLFFGENTSGDPLLENGGWRGFKNFVITIDGQKSNTTIQYNYNFINNIMEVENQTREEFCGDMILSPYFTLDGGDCVDETGMVLTCHSMQFCMGNEFIYPPLVKLKYNYAYI